MKILYFFCKHIILFFVLLGFVFNVVAKEMYKWTDEDGTIHITDKKSEVPPDILENLEKLEWNSDDSEYYQNVEINDMEFQYQPDKNYIDEIVDTAHERKLKREWRARAKELEDRKLELEYKLRRAKEDYKYKKKELEYLIVEGYAVDYRIRELNELDGYIKELEQEQKEISPLLDNLRIEARKAGIPEGYLRP